MAELHLGKKHRTDYGSRYSGVVESDRHETPITWREPPKNKQSGMAYVMATGWLGEKASMRLPAHEAVRAGHIAVTFGYTNRRIDDVLQRNAEDLTNVIDSLPAGLKKSAIALSMSGRVLVQALARTQSELTSATLVAAAGYIDGNDHSWKEIGEHFGATGIEAVGMFIKNPSQALYVGGTTVRNCARRGLAVAAEFGELIHGTEHDNLMALKAEPSAPHMRFMYGVNDRLLPAWAQVESVANLPFDEVESYQGGHLALVHDQALSRRIFELDGRLPLGEPLQAAA